jgi:hypothetical protein
MDGYNNMEKTFPSLADLSAYDNTTPVTPDSPNVQMDDGVDIVNHDIADMCAALGVEMDGGGDGGDAAPKAFDNCAEVKVDEKVQQEVHPQPDAQQEQEGIAEEREKTVELSNDMALCAARSPTMDEFLCSEVCIGAKEIFQSFTKEEVERELSKPRKRMQLKQLLQLQMSIMIDNTRTQELCDKTVSEMAKKVQESEEDRESFKRKYVDLEKNYDMLQKRHCDADIRHESKRNELETICKQYGTAMEQFIKNF